MCYFNSSKILWTWASVLGLRSKYHLKFTKILIALLKALINIPFNQGENYWANICKMFIKNTGNYTQFLKYFQKNWLNKYQIKGKTVEELRFRTK